MQSTLYAVTLPPTLGSRIRLIVDGGPVVDTQDSSRNPFGPTEYLAWQPGPVPPTVSAAAIVAVVDTGDGTPSTASCAIPPAVHDGPLTPEQLSATTNAGALTTFQNALDRKVNNAGVPLQGFGDTVRSVAMPTPHHTLLVAYQRDHCLPGSACPNDTRLNPAAKEITSVYCVDFRGASFNVVESPPNGHQIIENDDGWPSLAQEVAEASSKGFCQ